MPSEHGAEEPGVKCRQGKSKHGTAAMGSFQMMLDHFRQ